MSENTDYKLKALRLAIAAACYGFRAPLTALSTSV